MKFSLSAGDSSFNFNAFVVLSHKQDNGIAQLIVEYLTNSMTYIVPFFILKQFFQIIKCEYNLLLLIEYVLIYTVKFPCKRQTGGYCI